MLLRNRGVVSKRALIDELGVSLATFKRDLAMLRDRLNAPILFDAERGGYRLAESGFGPQYELPGLWFNDREVLALLTMHRMLEDLDTGGLLGPHVAPLVDRLNKLLEKPHGSADEIRQRVRIMPAQNRPAPPKWFEVIGNALVKRLRLEIDYFTRTRDERSRRVVSPQRLVHYRNAWYVDAWCHQANAMRVFALDAIEHARALDRKALEISQAEVDRAIGTAYGIFRGRERRWALLLFTKDAARWVRSEIWHPKQQGRDLDDGRYELKLPYSESPELEMDILRHGEQVEVVAPAALRAKVAQRLRAAAARYPTPVSPPGKDRSHREREPAPAGRRRRANGAANPDRNGRAEGASAVPAAPTALQATE